MACGGCLQVRHAVIRVVLGPRIADKLVPNAHVYIPPPKTDKPKETIVRPSVIVRAKPRG